MKPFIRRLSRAIRFRLVRNIHSTLPYRRTMMGTRPFFPPVVMIETTSYCNAFCTLCPYGKFAKTIPKGDMTEDLYRKLLDECGEHRDAIRRFSPYLYNEPLLDKRLIRFLQYARSKLPTTTFYISTNGSMLIQEWHDDLLDLLDSMTISVQGASSPESYKLNMPGLDYHQTMDRIDGFLARWRSRKTTCRLKTLTVNNLAELKLFDQQKKFWAAKGVTLLYQEPLSRGGTVAGLKGRTRPVRSLRGCWDNLPLCQIPITFNGDVVLCCQDCGKSAVVGNVAKDTIAAVWNSTAYDEMRRAIYFGRKTDKRIICQSCELALG